MGVWVAKMFVSSHNPFSRKCRRKSRLYSAKSGSARVGGERSGLAFPRRDLSSRTVVVKSDDTRVHGRAGALPYRIITWICFSGRNVIDAFGFTVWPGTISNRQQRKTSVSTIPSSIQAKPSPMQDLGPPPNGKKAYFGRVR